MRRWSLALALLVVALAGGVNGSRIAGFTELAMDDRAQFQQMAGAPAESAQAQAPAPMPGSPAGSAEAEAAAPMPEVSVSDNYEAASNADDLITKALEHGTLSAAQAKAILAAAKSAASADAAKVGAAKKIVEAAKSAEGEVAEEASAANAEAAKAAGKVAADEKQLREDEQAAGPPASIAQQKQAALNSANQRLAAAMAYAASETRNMDRALAAETAAKASEEARVALADAKDKTDAAEVAARNLADVSQGMSSPSSHGFMGGQKNKNDVGEKVGIAIFFILLVAALLFWWFQYGRGSASAEDQYASGGMVMDSAADYGSMNYGRQRTDTTV